MKTFLAKKETLTQPKWYLIDAKDVVLGRLAVKAANIIRGRNKASYTPHVDTGDYVIVINADAKATHQSVVDVMQAAQSAGYPRISFATQAPQK
mgnify:CR=1 FL=1